MTDGKCYYTKKYYTSSQGNDFKGRLSPGFIYALMIATSSMHLNEHYCSVEKLKDINVAYILSKVDVRFESPVMPYWEVELSTWARSSGILKLFRNFTLTKDAEVLAQASTLWAAIDLDSRRFIKSDRIPYSVQTYEKDVDANTDERIVMPVEMTKVLTKTVNYTDIDIYMHMNNTKYIEIVLNCLPLFEKDVKRIRLDFVHECKYGDDIDVYVADDGENVYYVKGVKTDGSVSFNSKIWLL